MKRYLLLFTILASAVLGRSQAVLNEVYFNPAAGEKEYIELYNSGTFQNLDCYTLLALYDDGVSSGFYVINFPDIDMNSNSFSVLAQTLPLNYQNGTYNGTSQDFAWDDLITPTNGGYIKQFKRIVPTPASAPFYEEVTPPLNTNNILTTLPSTYGSKYVLLLYKGNKLVNGISINGTNGAVPVGLANMPNLDVPSDGGSCVGFTAYFSAILPEQLEYMQPAIGNANGARRTSDGKCGTWEKAAKASDHNPGVTNGPSSATTSAQITVGGNIDCTVGDNGKRSATYFIVNASTDAIAYPLVLQIYQDAGSVPGQLDANDVFLQEQFIEEAPPSGQSNTVYQVQLPYLNAGTIVVAKAESGCLEAILAVTNSCITLPVKFQSFTAVRNKNNVAIKWETSTEINNRGFYIQRNINGSWENIAFVFSQADNGNSNSVLSYSYNDLNTTKGVTQYRIQQVDLDGKARYSEIRSVRGEANISKLLVYPNPTTSGSVNVVFEDQSPKNVTILDMSGRMIKQYRNVINNVSVDNLENGIYSIQVTDVSTATISVEKVVVKKR